MILKICHPEKKKNTRIVKYIKYIGLLSHIPKEKTIENIADKSFPIVCNVASKIGENTDMCSYKPHYFSHLK